LEAGTDIRTVQHLLGHADIATTMVYLHVTNRLMSKVESPLEKIVTDVVDPFDAPLEENKKEEDNG